MALPVADTFTYSNGDLSAVAPTKWADALVLKCRVVSNTVQGSSGGGDSLSYWILDVFPNNQSAEMDVTGASYPGLAVRCTALNGYVTYLNGSPPNNLQLEKIIAASRSNLGAFSFTSGHRQKFTATGTTLEVFDAGASIGSLVDAALASGAPGVFMYEGASAQGDNWAGDSVPPFSPTVSVKPFNFVTY